MVWGIQEPAVGSLHRLLIPKFWLLNSGFWTPISPVVHSSKTGCMKRFKITSLLTLTIATTTVTLGLSQPGLAKPISLQCLNRGGGFQIEALIGQSKTPLLRVSNASGIRQKCEQVSAQLKKAIASGDVEKLMIVAHSIRRRNALCVVRSVQEGCNQANLLLDVPEGRDRDEFLNEVLNIDTEKFFSGSEGQHTKRRYYSKFGKAMVRLKK